VNSQELVEDYRKRTKHITELTQKIKELRAREAEMKEVIEAYQRKVKKESLQK
jgi:cell division protein FtsB